MNELKSKSGKQRIYESDAERQRAYRERREASGCKVMQINVKNAVALKLERLCGLNKLNKNEMIEDLIIDRARGL